MYLSTIHEQVVYHTFVRKFCITMLTQEAQLMLTNPGDTFRGQSRSPNMVQFDMLGMVYY